MRVIFTSDMTVHFGHRKYSQWDSKSAPKNSQSFIIPIGQAICKENIIEVNLEQIIPPLRKILVEPTTVLSSIFRGFGRF